ncbi:NADPH:quinone oxidoreductase family protein [Marinibactrum halimedae]|uniref:NADPH:quinone oxidoreductase n=1 Tax=Marinibactrum halimedae TaxID=1444977 RepID=A0AA37WKA4_9GAMM|nr:NADPH:quinone oxidoreductase family protein [Marinibactrum halimedae]MCD9459107.1 NADPH:quinone oxidoreductase family protein [Marinibactrum halimedae]GLS24708.1 NADPH:quinone oxidoreductase [Marinibactrum halimedae]
MKAIVCEEFAPIDQLKYREFPVPTVKPGHVLIDVLAAGVNFPDGLIVQGKYQVKPECPFVPGGEVAGVIREVGEGVPHLTPGRTVVALPRVGGYAETVLCPMSHVMPLPDFIPPVEAAGLITAHATAHHALKQRANLQPGETLAITGAAGGTGIAAVQIGKAMGATVIAICSTEEKLAFAKSQGADILINSSTSDVKAELKKINDGKGVDVVYETVGGDLFHACTRAMAWKGRLLVVGFAGGTIPEFPINLALVKGFSVVGVFWGSFTAHEPQAFMDNMQELVAWYQQGKVKVVVDTVFPLEQAQQALEHVTGRKVMGKVMLQIGEQ